MANHSQNHYGTRLEQMEQNLGNHDNRLEQIHARNDTHSARLHAMNQELEKLREENAMLKNQVSSFRASPNDLTIMPQELARRYDKKYDSRPYFDEQDPPSFYRDLALTDRSGYGVERRAPHFDHAPLTDRPERNRRSPPPPRHAFDDMAKGQMKKEMDKIELHDANFKPYSHHNHGGVVRFKIFICKF